MTLISRRDVLRGGAAMGAMAALGPIARKSVEIPGYSHARSRARLRAPESLPDPSRPMGTPDASLPFNYVICWMMENHSFDNYFGMLSQRGQPRADGFRFDRTGQPDSDDLRNPIARLIFDLKTGGSDRQVSGATPAPAAVVSR